MIAAAEPVGAPTDRDALLRQAIDLRAARRAPEALAVLDRLQGLHPRFSRALQERGHCHVLLGDAPSALKALGEAVRLNPSLPASWDMLEQLHRMRGETGPADGAAQRLAMLRRLPPEIVAADSLLADGDLAEAETVIRDVLYRQGPSAGALRLLARIRQACGDAEEAETLLEGVLASAPDYEAARFDYAMILLQRQKPQAARREAERLLQREPERREHLKLFAAACVALGDYEPVIEIYRRLLDGAPVVGAETAELRLWRANALKVTGRLEEAVADYRAALAARPDYGVAWFSLANLKLHSFSDADVERLQAAAARTDLQDMDRVYLAFALGKALEDRADYAGSWRWYAQGNEVRRSLGRYRPEVAEACAARTTQAFTAEVFNDRADCGAPDADPIFVLGLPRSGSTLIEQILASHSQVEGTQELTEIGRYAGELFGRDPDCGLPVRPAAVLQMSAAEARALGERFLAETRTYRREGRPFFIDKMPNNFWHIGLIHLILPKAKIIDVRREPMACCFSNLKQLFGTTNQEFTNDIDAIARYYRSYLDLMRHWDEVLPGRVLRVQYEDLVEDLEGGVRRMLEHCGLAFEPACLDFHQTRRSVRTPSSEQVRRPISRDGLAQWRNYEPWLAPLQAALGDALIRYRD
ncbi:sulfotransferase [Brevundimonas sp. EAKA]|jgi:tetratricopeptide (TPR) repeat protein|uniref:Tetratricopeptide repeat protein n=1 Tax=Brevundimonas mediterranea TaxID=74329 RepID=A0AB37E3K8_9CAUL|nr:MULTISPECIES: sulfotransferase [Brevundimonas]OYX81571.1 MAG: sulfotransferase family protein [Brevundimonas sp. 32-68-21]EDX81372.1 Sulfotransferase domain family [Brevundimonas sp. BAL3]KDP93853.1 sulfotransferase [Brevundimonas sp. EAKA]MBA4331048.1 sulfotransferase family protein [Brevundimonas sp.]QIH71682.1 tetratricopeptide repeat protein [Brevundimonas mediterranea]